MEERNHVDREMVRGLCAALDPVVAAEPAADAALAFEAARNVAQLLELHGLDRLLGALAGLSDRRRSPEVGHALERVRRERDRGTKAASLAPFREADRELAALASHLEGVEWSEGPDAGGATGFEEKVPRDAVIDLAGALGAVRYADEGSGRIAREVRLHAPVAAVLRAALDWMFGDAEDMAPLRIGSDGPTVEIEGRGADPNGLLPAHEVIAAVGGSMTPLSIGRGTWAIRMPAAGERDLYLMLRQGGLQLALPWANVLRIQMETREDEPLAAPPLAPLDPLAGPRAGRPVVTVGLGLRRGSLAADRLVWRLGAVPFETDVAAPAGATHAVRTDDDEIFWVIDVAKLMRDVPLPELPAMDVAEPLPSGADPAPDDEAPPGATAPAPETAAPPSYAPATPEPETAAPAPRTPADPGAGWHGPLKLFLLTGDDVERIDAPEAPPVDRAPQPAGAPATPPAVPAPPAPAAPADAEDDYAPPRLGADPAPASGPPAPGAPPRMGAPRLGFSSVLPVGDGGAATPYAASGHGRRALIAEDSFMARIFLTRLLQMQGYNVHSVGTAAALRDAIAGESWALLCIDVDLPDARGASFVREISDSQLDRPEPAVVVALVRDWSDQQEAAAGGVHRVLRKPFVPKDVIALLQRAGLPLVRPS